jgi:predicted nucleic acid-binding protein
MLVFDASSIIYAWDNYPIEMFPTLWDWLAAEITSGRLAIPEVAYDEVEHRSPECHAWLQDAEIPVIDVEEATLLMAAAIKELLGIQGDAYHADGVGENDLLIIACASVHGHSLISDERKQVTLPNLMKRFKIPAVCNHAHVRVVCLNFLAFIKSSNVVF